MTNAVGNGRKAVGSSQPSVFDRVKAALEREEQPARADLLEVCYRAEIAAEIARFNVRLSPYMRAVMRVS